MMQFVARLSRARLTLTVLVVAAVGLGAGLRLTDLESNPPGLWQDEASTGLDAYLIWHTGRDQRGDWLPIIARSFGDYPLAGYRYLAAPIVGVFGLTPGNERLVAAVTGTLFLVALFVAMRERTTAVAALGAVLAGALCPTWIHFSRYGSEAILLPFALTAGWAFIELERPGARRAFIWLGAVLFASSAYTYHAVKLVLPLWMIAFVLFQFPRVRTLHKTAPVHLYGPALVFLLLVAPSVVKAFTPEGMARANTVLATTHYEGWRLIAETTEAYLSYFDPRMLFLRGGPHIVQSIPGLGLWNFVDLPLLIVGFVALVRGRFDGRFCAFLVFWFLLGPLPGGSTGEAQNLGRAIAWLPAPQMLAGLGFAVLASYVRGLLRSPSPRCVAVAAALIAAGGVAWGATALHVYRSVLVRYPRIAHHAWQFEISETLRCAKAHRVNERIYVSPSFQVASMFARYHFIDLEEPNGKGRVWRLGDRRRMVRNQLYAFPANRKAPVDGQELCRIEDPRTRKAVGFVYGPPGKSVASHE